MIVVRIPVWPLIAALLVAVVAGAVCAWWQRRRRWVREINAELPLMCEEIPHPPP